MNATQLLRHFDRLAEAPDAVPRLRRFILDLAVRGKLVEQDEGDEPAREFLDDVQAERSKLVKAGEISPAKPLQPIVPAATPFPLPSGWEWTRFGTLINHSDAGFSPKTEGFPRAGNHWGVVKVSAVSWNQFKPEENKQLLDEVVPPEVAHIHAGDFLISRANTSELVAKCVIVDQKPEKLILSDKTVRLRLTTLGNPHFWCLVNNHAPYAREYYATQASGTSDSMKNVSRPIIYNLPMPLPPLAEQHRIVAKVDELMALCDQLEAAQQERERRRDRLAAASLQRLNQPTETNPATDQTEPAEARQQAHREQQKDHARFHLQNLHRLTTRPEHIKAMRQTFFNLAVRGKLVSQAREDEPYPRVLARIGAEGDKLPGNDNTAELPASWRWMRIDQIADVSSGTTPSRDVAEYYASDGTPWVTSGETSNEFITATAQHVSDLALKATNLKLYPPGTLIVAMYGQGKTRGQVAELTIAATTNQACAAIVLTLNDVGHRRYVKLFFRKIYEEIRELAAGGAQPNLNGGKIKSMLIPLPPLAEQHRIVAKVDELMALCDQLEAQLVRGQTDSRRLLEAVLDAALTPA